MCFPGKDEILADTDLITNAIPLEDSTSIISNVAKPISIKVTELYEFLSYLVVNNELSNYFFLLNEVAIEKFSEGVLVVAKKYDNIDYTIPAAAVGKCLFEWTGTKWDVIISRGKSGKESLKDSLIKNFYDSSDWKLICESFSNAELMDVYSKHSKL